MLRKKGKIWYVQYRDLQGRMNTKSLKVTDRDQAVKLEKMFMDSLRGQRALKQILKTFPQAAGNPTMPTIQEPEHHRGSIALKDMFEYASTRRQLSKDHKSAWEHFVRNIGVKYADEVTPRLCQKYLDTFFGSSSAKTYNNHKSFCNTVFRLCLVSAGITASPFAPIQNKALTDVKSHRNLTEEEIARIMETGDLQVRIMTMLSRWTGQRLETCARMTWEEFDFSRSVFLMKPGKTARFNKFVCIPIFAPLRDFLTSIRPADVEPSSPIIMLAGWANADAFSHKFSRLLDRMGIVTTADGMPSFHSLRGTFITWAKDSGIPADVRRSITGHSTLSTEDVYARAIASVSKVAGQVDAQIMRANK